ncbi:DUF1415 domain-containing protein [Aestuariibacter sp. A3R04]|uniref:DUF1415 domain-containing protein n=1 Tax=Aestuariibacter sp. A3R04 TaxID=2841571 RepID=UPI001C097587|nr:DUF1415 domain-containing protein [Aestuariibacter sp. A3R04]MBU3021839.1 DUF1415 domain-containing protein [Aestuariibacter sp. A3R04]
MIATERVVDATRAWLERVVIGYQFCPFAKPVHEINAIRYTPVVATDFAHALEAVYQECLYLSAHPDTATTLVIFPNGFDDFNTYLDLLAMAEQLMTQNRMNGEFQLASFHPDYLFDGEPADAPSHFTNRSPYPVIHIIREDDIEKAMKGKDDASAIFERNMAKANKLGREHFVKLLQAIRHTSADDNAPL